MAEITRGTIVERDQSLALLDHAREDSHRDANALRGS